MSDLEKLISLKNQCLNYDSIPYNLYGNGKNLDFKENLFNEMINETDENIRKKLAYYRKILYWSKYNLIISLFILQNLK